MSVRITVLCDNMVGPVGGTLGEHGFAALVEHPGGALLFDTGQGGTLLHNARRMGKDLRQVETVVLSHGHYDHSGGLLPLLQDAGGKRVLAHPAVFAPRYRVKDTGESTAIGIPATRETLTAAGAVFELTSGYRELTPEIALTGEVSRVTPFETGDRGLFIDPRGTTADTILDDQSLVIRSPKGLVLLLGCCHSGVVNTIEAARRYTGVQEVYAILGGTHLGFCSLEQLAETIAILKKNGIRKVCTSHCTGFPAAARLSREMPGEFQLAAVGYTLEV